MKEVSLTLDVSETKKQFAPLFSIINRSSVLPILQDVRIVQDGFLKFMASDLENFITVSKEAQNKIEFDFCVDAERLKPFFYDNLGQAVIISGNEKKINIENEGFKVSIGSLGLSENFPKPAIFNEGVSEKMNSKLLCGLLEKAILFLSHDDLRPAMTGIYIYDWNGKLFVVATDAHRLFYKEVMLTPDSFKGFAAIISNKAAKLFIQMFPEEEIEIKKDGLHLFFAAKNKELITRLVDAKYPDFTSILIKDCQYKFSLQRKQLAAFLKIAKMFANISTHRIDLQVDNEGILFKGGDMDFDNEFYYKLPLFNSIKKIEPFCFSVNLIFMKEALSINKRDEYVYIEHSGLSTRGFVIDECLLMMPLITN